MAKESYRLELHWDTLEYHNDNIINVIGAVFRGPVLNNALKLEAPDSIEIDLTPQLLTVFDSYYIVRLDWAKCEYTADGDIKLFGATLTNKFLSSLHKFNPGDCIHIDTEKHEEKTHAFHLVYEAQIIRDSNVPYNFRESK